MLKKVTFLVLFTFTFLDAGTLRLYDEAIETQSGLLHLRKGMVKEDVLYIMGYPYQVQTEKSGTKCFEIWLYFYKKPSLSQKRILRRNLIPLIFYKNHLLGWGDKEYQYFVGTDNQGIRRAREHEPRYTNDKEEWPTKDHGYVPSPSEELRKKADQKAAPSQTKPGTQREGAPLNTSTPYPAAIFSPDKDQSQPPAQTPASTPVNGAQTPQQQTPTNGAQTPQQVPPNDTLTPPGEGVKTTEEPQDGTEEQKGPQNIYIHTEYSKEYQQGEKRYQERIKNLEDVD